MNKRFSGPIQFYLKDIENITKDICSRLNIKDLDDAFGEAYLSYVIAYNKYDSNKADFMSQVYWHIEDRLKYYFFGKYNSIQSGMTKKDLIKFKEINRIKNIISSKGIIPTFENVKEYLREENKQSESKGYYLRKTVRLEQYVKKYWDMNAYSWTSLEDINI